MAADDPNEKSLFCRIKDCVLTELDRSKNEVKRTKCSSRSMWIWDLGQSSKPAEGTESQKVDKELPQREITRSSKDNNSEDKNENKDERLRGGHGKEKKARDEETISERNEHERKHENVHKDDKEETHLESNKHKERHSHSAEKEREKCEGSKKSADHPNSCDSNKCKPVRYYIKMQDPEAPPCCETRKPRKICPPKMRKYQDESRSHCPSRPSCRCEGCVAEFNQKRYSMN